MSLGSSTNFFLGAGAGGAAPAPAGYQIERSLRFARSDSAFLNRTPSTAGNRRTWTISVWCKKGINGVYMPILQANPSTNPYLNIVFTITDQIRWLDGSNQGQVLTDAVFRDNSAWYHIVCAVDTTQSTATDRVKIYVNGVRQDVTFPTTVTQNHQTQVNATTEHRIGRWLGTSTNYLDGYLAEYILIDGQALAPTDFGEYDDNGVWQPKEYAGSYGPLVNQSEVWSNALSGTLKTPTAGFDADPYSGRSEGTGGLTFTPATSIVFSDKVEVYDNNNVTKSRVNSGSYVQHASNAWVTVASGGGTITTMDFLRTDNPGFDAGFYAIRVDGKILIDQGVTVNSNGFHLDFSDNSSDAALGTDSSANNNNWTVNNITANAPGLATAKQGMDVVTYTGNGSTQTISGLQFQPDFVWIKSRSTAYSHRLFDQVRGTDALYSDTTEAEGTNSINENFISYNSDGFTVGSTSGINALNNNGTTFVAWAWKAGGTALSNTDGSITSQVSANTTYGFSVVSYTGNGTSGATVGHGLSTAPKFIILKNRDTAVNWLCYHEAVGATKYIPLNLTDAATAWGGFLNNTAPSSSVITLGNGTGPNGNTNDIIAYCWSEVAGFSKFGSYTGTGAVGHKITTGFKPAYILFKRTDSLSNWRIVDEKRGISSLNAETNEIEQTLNFAINADGFTINETGNNPNASGGTYIYAAFAGTPAGEDVDSLFDSPTNGVQTDTGAGGQVSGNYATLNPLNIHNSASDTLSNGNLECSMVSGSAGLQPSTIAFSSGKWYYETVYSDNGSNGVVGIRRADSRNFSNSYLYHGNGNKYTNAGSATAYGATYTNGDLIGVAVDMDAGTLTFYKNGTTQGQAFTGISGTYTFIQGMFSGTTGAYTVNFGQRAFAFAQSGFKALNTANLSDPTLADGSDYMDVVTYTATGGTAQSIAGLEFNPDLVWLKAKVAGAHNIFDSVRGATKGLRSNDTAAEYADSETLTSFDSNGFSLGPDSNGYQVNYSNNPMVGWTWDAGHPATAATGAVSFGNNTGSSTDDDYLTVPSSSDFAFGTGDFTIEYFLYLNSVPSVITVPFDMRPFNTDGAYAQMSVTTALLLRYYVDGAVRISSTISTKKWLHIAISRSGSSTKMFVNGVQAGSTYSDSTNYQQSGITISNNQFGSTDWGIPGLVSNFRIVNGTALYTSNFTPPTAELTNVTNTKLLCCQSTTSATAAAVTPGTITANGDVTATTFNPLDAFSVNGTGYATTSAAGITEGTIPLTGASVNRSAGFSIVSYTGVDTPSSNTVGHGLNVAPVFWIIKNRTNVSPQGWVVNFTFLDNSVDYMFLNLTNAKADQGAPWSTLPTSTVFTLGANDGNTCDAGANFIAYCFAPVEGYSAFGSYTGNGSADGPFVYTGHRSRWLMVKRTDTSGYPWVIVDALRDGYNVTYKWLEPNSFSAEQSVQPVADVDFLSNGFKMRGAGNTTNQLAGTYIYAAFAENPFKTARAR